MNDRLRRQLEFIEQTDALKSVERRTAPIGLPRRENSAEHSWQVTLTAMLLAEHANEPVDVLRVIKMLLIHDLPEIDVGDVFHYDKDGIDDLHERELAATKRLLSYLPADQAAELLSLWQEFESRETADARFAAAVDRFMAFLMNRNNGGGTWAEYQLAAAQVLDKNAHIVAGADSLWQAVTEIVETAVKSGHLTEERDV
ncbi:MAG: HD domain-containing protein [Gammaproteobacteria bacterium]|nr:HD domain-containing protein [Gammaproteobacteria bacterium]